MIPDVESRRGTGGATAWHESEWRTSECICDGAFECESLRLSIKIQKVRAALRGEGCWSRAYPRWKPELRNSDREDALPTTEVLLRCDGTLGGDGNANDARRTWTSGDINSGDTAQLVDGRNLRNRNRSNDTIVKGQVQRGWHRVLAIVDDRESQAIERQEGGAGDSRCRSNLAIELCCPRSLGIVVEGR